MIEAPVDDLLADLARESAGEQLERSRAPYRREVSSTRMARIRALYDGGHCTIKELAVRFGLSPTKTWRVVQGRTGNGRL
jgi:hypothetical protein